MTKQTQTNYIRTTLIACLLLFTDVSMTSANAANYYTSIDSLYAPFYQAYNNRHANPQDSTYAFYAALIANSLHNKDGAQDSTTYYLNIAKEFDFSHLDKVPWYTIIIYKIEAFRYLNASDYYNALLVYQQMEKAARDWDDKELLIRVYLIGYTQIYTHVGNCDAAKEAIKQCLIFSDNPREQISYEVFGLRFIDECASFTANDSTLLQEYNEIVDIQKRMKALNMDTHSHKEYVEYYHHMLSVMGATLTKLKRYDEALPILKKVISYFEQQKYYTDSKTSAHIYLAQIYITKNQLNDAFAELSKVPDGKKLYASIQLAFYDTFQQYYEKAKNYEKANEYAKKGFDYVKNDFFIKKAGDVKHIRRYHSHISQQAEAQRTEALLASARAKRTFWIIFASFAVLISSFLTILLLRVNRKNRELNQVNNAKNKVFSVLSHDLRSPLSSLISLFDMLLSHHFSPDKQRTLLTEGANRLKNTFALTENLLWWTRSQMNGLNPSPELVNPQTVVDEVVKVVTPLTEQKKILLTVHIEGDSVFVDPQYLTIILRNLITNAIKFTPAGGSITIVSQVKEDTIQFAVSDTGVGMDEDAQRLLFASQFANSTRGTNNEAGSGLGLSLCAEFLSASNGRIWLTSKLNHGTTFFFSLPKHAVIN